MEKTNYNEREILNLILEDSKTGWWIKDDNRSIITLSDFIQYKIGLPTNELTYLSFIGMVREDYRDRIKEELSPANQQLFNQTFPLNTPNGTVWVHAKGIKDITNHDSIISVGRLEVVDDPEVYAPEKASTLRTNNLLFQLHNISQILLSFIQTDDPDKVINNILKDILKQFKAGRTYIFEYNFDKQTQTNTYEVVDDNVKPEIENLKELPFDMNSWWTDHITKKREPIILSTLNDLPPEAAAEKEFLAIQDINSLFVTPLMSKNGTWGYVGVDIVDGYHTWTKEDAEWLQAMFNIVSMCIQLQRSENRARLDKEHLERARAKLIEAKEKAEGSDRLKSAFLANMSHEIRTPLNAIIGFSDLITVTDDPDERATYSDIVHKNNEMLLQLVSDILDISKIEAGTLDVVDGYVDINQMCKEIIHFYELKTEDGPVKVIFDQHLPSCTLYSDKNRLTQILNNFINNALKFTTEGGIYLGYQLVDDDKIKFYVRDTGCGIEPKNLGNVFERFVKLNSFVPGTGLGLSICKSLVEQMGGEIGVESELGKGSCFWFTHPFQPELQVEPKKTVKKDVVKPSLPSSENNGSRRPVILVAEDTESNYMLLTSIFKNKYELVRAYNGQEAVDLFKQVHPDIILMDMRMPVMDGIEATKQIRATGTTTPIIAVTAFAFDSDKERVLAAGCNAYISKPIKSTELIRVIDDFIKKP